MVVLTGASGFIGKHLFSKLAEIYGKKNVLAFTSHPIPSGSYLLHQNYTFKKDIFLKNGFENVEVFIHAGAFTPKNPQESNHVEFSNSNILNTQKILELELPKLSKVIFLSTLDVYGKADLITENTIEHPISLYGYSKLYCEKMLQTWAEKNDKKLQILRVGHIFGPGEEEYKKVIPETMKSIISGKQVQLWGTGQELRSFLFIDDLVQSIVNSISLSENPGIINLVSEQSISIRKLIEKIISISGKSVSIEKISFDGTIRNLVFDNQKMKKFLLDKETKLEDGLIKEYHYLKNLYESHI